MKYIKKNTVFFYCQFITSTLFAPKIEIFYFKNTNPAGRDVQVKLNKEEVNPNENSLLPTFVKKFCSKEFIKFFEDQGHLIKNKRWLYCHLLRMSFLTITHTPESVFVNFDLAIEKETEPYFFSVSLKYEIPESYKKKLLETLFTLKQINLPRDVIKYYIIPFLLLTYEFISEEGSFSDKFISEEDSTDLDEIYATKKILNQIELREKSIFYNKDMLNRFNLALVERKEPKQREWIENNFRRWWTLSLECNKRLRYSKKILNWLYSLQKSVTESLFNTMLEQLKHLTVITVDTFRIPDIKIELLKNVDHELKLIVMAGICLFETGPDNKITLSIHLPMNSDLIIFTNSEERFKSLKP